MSTSGTQPIEVDAPEPNGEGGFSRPSATRDEQLDGSPQVDISGFPGRLIVLEGTDNVGRSTHIALLREWLESRGFGVAHTALRRGRLAADGLSKAKQGHTLGPLTLDLYYATDFADRLDNFILPALRAGFVVLTDRYAYSAIARSMVRGNDAAWVHDLYSFAPRPHAVFYLDAELADLIPRVLAGGGFDFWESGMDFQEESDIYAAFLRYQDHLLQAFRRIAAEEGMTVVDSGQPMATVFRRLCDGVAQVVGTMQGARL